METRRRIIYGVAIVAIIVAAIVRSSIATSLDSFTFDEAYHIGAGVAYAKTGDFRLNPEHPPLTKLWVGAYVSALGYNLSPFRPFADKIDERSFVEDDVYNKNDPDAMQTRARTAMFALDGILLLIFAAAVWRVFGGIIAIASITFLAIDPTVAAHLPVVMTDLPVALLSGTAVLMAVQAYRSWRLFDIALATLAAGLALGSKHSAVITLIAIVIIGLIMAVFADRKVGGRELVRRFAYVFGVAFGALIVLWGLYLFSYHESRTTSDDQFNRPLVQKISDVKSPVYRWGLSLMADARLVPRAYTWGLADTIRAGAEGRVNSVMAFGNLYYSKAPWFYSPGIIAVKLPLGLLLLSLIGAALLVSGAVAAEHRHPIIALLAFCALFMFFLIRGSSYGGVRHVLPVFPALAILAAFVADRAVRTSSYVWVGALSLAVVVALASAIPVMRPWEYFNETVGGPSGGHRYFNDEGVDLSLRSTEAIRYYHEHLKPAGEVPYTFYLLPPIDDPAKTLDYVGKDPERDKGKWEADSATGTFIVGANEISPALWWDKKAFREAEPVARFGNLFVFRGTFDIRSMRAQLLDYRAGFQIYGSEPNIDKAIEMLTESAAIDPKAFFVSLELGNQYLKLGKKDEALSAYAVARDNAPQTDQLYGMLGYQIERLKTEPIENVTPLRNPWLE